VISQADCNALLDHFISGASDLGGQFVRSKCETQRLEVIQAPA
jgi:hypothetical protein